MSIVQKIEIFLFQENLQQITIFSNYQLMLTFTSSRTNYVPKNTLYSLLSHMNNHTLLSLYENEVVLIEIYYS